MLARAACRVLSLLCAILYLVAGVHGGSKPERKRITDALLRTVAKGGGGYPPQQALHGGIRWVSGSSGGGGHCGAGKKAGPAAGARRAFFGK